MKRHILVAVLFSCNIFLPATISFAQFYPGYGYGGWGGMDGSAALLGADYRQAAVIQARSQSRVAGQEAAINQNLVVQSGIRNTLSNQAQSRSDEIQRQQQSTQDWWFQQQSQKVAQRNAVGYASVGMPAGLSGSFAPSGGPPPAAMDIIQWPSLLQEPCFASERTQIESPYRRTPPRLSAPSQADYRQMASTVEDMKAVLEWRLSEGVNTDDYKTAKAFLIKLGQEVAGRAQSGGNTN
jgi:hypothetical protein